MINIFWGLNIRYTFKKVFFCESSVKIKDLHKVLKEIFLLYIYWLMDNFYNQINRNLKTYENKNFRRYNSLLDYDIISLSVSLFLYTIKQRF